MVGTLYFCVHQMGSRTKRGSTARILTKRNRQIQLPIDAAIYVLRNMVERLFNKFKYAQGWQSATI